MPVAVPSYRLAPEVRLIDIIDDLRRCCLFLWQRYKRRLVIAGHSAGGHLAAAMLATDWKSLCLPEDVVKACFPQSGIYDLRPRVEGEIARDLVGGFLASDEQIERASPLLHVRGNRTPFYMAHGSRDLPELIPQARRMSRALADQPAEAAMQEFPDYDHFAMSERCDREDHPWVRTVREWMKRDYGRTDAK